VGAVLFPERPVVKTRQDFERLLFELLDHNDAVQWRNDTAYRFLQAMAGWLADAEGFYKNLNDGTDPDQPSWPLFADMLQAATEYE
jgi:hypothetical protein